MTFRTRKLTPGQIESIELQRVGWVIGETDHGALTVEPGFGLSYDGCPEWLQREMWDTYGMDATFATKVVDGGGYLCPPEPTITDQNGIVWELVGTYTFSGETTCPMEDGSGCKVTREECAWVPDPYRHSKGLANPGKAYRAECPMCEARIGEEHGYIYIGEGYEAVYRLREDTTEGECSECGEALSSKALWCVPCERARTNKGLDES